MSPAVTGPGPFLCRRSSRLFARVQADRDLLEIQQDVDHVFLHAFDAGVLVQYAVDLSLGDGAAGHGRQQHAAQRVAQGMAEATLEGLDHDLRLLGVGGGDFDDARLQEFANGCLHGRFTCLVAVRTASARLVTAVTPAVN